MIKDFFAADDYWKKRLSSLEMQLGVVCLEIGAQFPATRGRLEAILDTQRSLCQQMESEEVKQLLTGDTPAVRWHNQMVQSMGLDIPLLPVEPVLPVVPLEESMSLEAMSQLLRASLNVSVCHNGNYNGGLCFTDQQTKDAPRLEAVVDGKLEPINGFYRYRDDNSTSYNNRDHWALLITQGDQVVIVKFPYPIHAIAYTLLPYDKLWVKHSYIGASWNYARFETDYHTMLLEQYNFLMPPIVTEEQMLEQFGEAFGGVEFNLDLLPYVTHGLDPRFTGAFKNRTLGPEELAVIVVIALNNYQMIARLKLASDGKNWVSVHMYFYVINSVSNFSNQHCQLNPGRDMCKEWSQLLPFDQQAMLEQFIPVRDKILADQQKVTEVTDEPAE